MLLRRPLQHPPNLSPGGSFLKGHDSDLLCETSPTTGRLLEFGRDPLEEDAQKESRWRRREAKNLEISCTQEQVLNKVCNLLQKSATTQGPSQENLTEAAPSAQVLRLVIGLLGLEVHEKPSPWAEAWLTYQDGLGRKLGLDTLTGSGRVPDGSHDEPEGEEDPQEGKADPRESLRERRQAHHRQQQEWQVRVLSHLKKAAAHGAALDATRKEPGPSACQWGPDFAEHLDLADFMLKRIANSVCVLQDPEKEDRPSVFRQYTEEMVAKVCDDLKQWLEQLATLISLYHVLILDLEGERGRLSQLLLSKQGACADAERRCKDAEMRHELLQQRWKEEKMKHRAEAVLGITLQGEDAAIYTQADVDQMMKELREEEVDPLEAELAELKKKLGDVIDKQGVKRRASVTSSPFDEASVRQLVHALTGLAERDGDAPHKKLLTRVAEFMDGDHSDELPDILRDISCLPMPVPKIEEGFADNHPVQQSLTALAAEFGSLEEKLRAVTGGEKLRPLSVWARDLAASVRTACASTDPSSLRWNHAPQWELGDLGTTKTVVVNRASVDSPSSGSNAAGTGTGMTEAQFQARLRAMREELMAQARAAQQRAAEEERRKAEEALARMADELAKADATLAELRRRLLELERLLREKGLGKQVNEAIAQSGISDYMSKDVFERLYRDALNRMRRMAEAQARSFEDTSQGFLLAIDHMLGAYPAVRGISQQHQDSSVAHDQGTPMGHHAFVSKAPDVLAYVPNRGSMRPSSPDAVRGDDQVSLAISRFGSQPTAQALRPDLVACRAHEVIAQVHGQRRSRPLQQRVLVEAGSLPPLECRGAGASHLGTSAVRSSSGSGVAYGGRGEGRSGSPSLEKHLHVRAAPRSFAPGSSDAGPALLIGSLRPPRTGGSLLLPPETRAAETRDTPPPSRAAVRPRLIRSSSGTRSTPSMGPPRLLVQSVGGAY